MCTVVCHWDPAAARPVRMLAVRDELSSRAFDTPAEWWPDHPGVIGGRDRRAGGTWCASEVVGGVTAVVLNRPERMTADPGAASRGVLPLLATKHGAAWPEHVAVAAMAGFTLVLATPEALTWWTYIGGDLQRAELDAGTHVFTPRGLLEEQSPFAAALPAGDDNSDTEDAWNPWFELVRSAQPAADRAGLLVRRPIEDDSFESVFAQFLAARPGTLRIDHLEQVARNPRGPWTTLRLRA